MTGGSDKVPARSVAAEDEARVLQHVRDEIWRMTEPDHVEGVLRAVRDGLRTLGVEFHGIGINNVTEDRASVHHFSFAGEESMWTTSSEPAMTRRIIDFMQADQPTYRADLLADDPWDERARIVNDWGTPIRCIIDVPFESGTLALNSANPNAFSAADQALLRRMAVALQEGFRRLRDLQALQDRSREAERLAAERQEALDHEVILGDIRDRVQSMRTLRDAPLRSDWMKILQQLGVPVNGMSVQFPGSTAGYYTSTGLSATSYFDDIPLNIHPWVSKAWETGESVLVHAAELEHSGLENWQSWCILEVPLAGGGSLGVNRRDGEVFTEEMIRRVEAFAAVVATGIQRLRDMERIEESEERHRSLVERLPLGVAHTTLDGAVLYQNESARRIYGYSADEWRQLNIADLYVNPEDRNRMVEGLRAQESFEFEYPMRHRDGQQIWIRGTSSFVQNQATGRVEIHGYFEDVTERKVMEENNTRLAEQLRQAQKMEAVGQLTAGIAHNFNNMLQGISGNLQLAMLDAEGNTRKMLADADRVTHRAADMIRQLMVFARQGLQPVERSVRLAPVIENTIEICRRTFDRRIRLQVEVDENVHAIGDPGLLQQVMLNLLINARDAVLHETDSPEISIRSEIVQLSAVEAAAHLDASEGPFARISVRDNGVGMDAATQQHMFEPFFTTKPVDQGTGLGLATVYGIVTQYGGWVACDSNPGDGTSFHIYLPPGDAEPIDAEDTPEPLASGAEARTLVIIDDEDVVRETTARLLRRQGFQVLSADSGPAGIELITPASVRVDLVLLDLSMPTMSGHQVLVALRELRPGLKVIIITGYATDEGEVAGADGILQKPFSVDELLRMIEQVLAD